MTSFHTPAFSLRQLQYAVAVAERGGFGSAAEHCGVSQPSLSAQIAKLESCLGVQIFERHARGILVTEAGRRLLERMKAVLRESDHLRDQAALLTDPYALRLRVGVIPTIAPYLLPPTVAEIRARDRAPRVHWIEERTSQCEHALMSGDLEAALIADAPSIPGLEAVEIGWEPFCLLVPTDHHLRAPVAMSDISPEELLLLEDGHCLRDHTLAFCAWPNFRESPFRATSLPTVVQMVAAGLGVSVLPASAIPIESRQQGIRCVPFESPSIGRTIRLARRTRSPHSEPLATLAELLRKALSNALNTPARY
ncbi:LysR family transcriptional regulator [Pseudenhygromyxa sp. WMMC2535]|uniref:LysR substrate-binding domain-containing protein n=1 Tax=Pseudenhygromyxa sp. WMMC2535 TaxID=2712867 RepID=UPI0015522454|nr:LysR substrate-binding domain-containing protein [Pseudenhygromyxa sp. WMMC2535]NVB40687.1 LysR family transcriptional regulator [Pseudenhygromyxa sp. WMMC2535]